MKTIISTIAFLILSLIFNTQNCICQWVQSNIYIGNIGNISSHNSTIYAASREMYKSSNNGFNWAKMNIPYSSTVTAISNNTNYLFVATSGNQIYRSSNGGQNWIDITYLYIPIRSMAANDSYICAGSDTRIIRSSNNGQNWTTPFQFLNSVVFSIVLNGTTAYAGLVGLPSYIKGVYISTNSGLNWSPTSLNNQSVRKVYLHINKLFAVADSGLYTSTNNGNNWTKENVIFNINSFCDFNSILYAATNEGIEKSTNNGLNWANTGMNNNKVLSVFVNSNTMVAGTDGEGVFYSTNNGLNWIQNGFNELGIFTLASNSNIIFVGTNTRGVVISTNSGQSFNYSTLDSVPVDAIIANGSNIYASNYQTVMFSSNNGLNWSPTTSPDGIEDLKISGTKIIGCKASGFSPFGVFATSNNGQNWVQIFNLFEGGVTLATSGSTIYFGSFGLGVYKSTDYGVNWIQTSLDTGVVLSLAINPPYVYAGTMYGVYKSTNNGVNWYHTSLNNIWIRGLTALGSNVFAGTDDGVYFSSNFGASWTLENAGMGTQSVNSFLIVNNYIYAGTGSYYNWPPLNNYNGLWRRPLSELTGVGSINQYIPSKFYLHQNYPNPFNPTTNIKYQIAKNSFVTIKIFDILGKEIETLVNEKQSPGTYEVTFDGSNLSSGVYFYKLSAGDFSEIKKMILIK